MTDDYWGKDADMIEAATKLLERIANSLESIDKKFNPITIEEESEDRPRFLGER